MAKDEKTVLEEAAIEYKNLMEAATNNAKDKLVNEMSDKFEKLLSEEINKLKDNKESVEESIVDEVKEPVNEGEEKNADEIKEPVEGNDDNLNESVDLRESSFEEIEGAYDESSPEDDFVVAGDDEQIDLASIEAELANMEEMAEEIDIQQSSETSDTSSDPAMRFEELYGEMTEVMNQLKQDKMQQEMEDKFDKHMRESFGDDYASLGEDAIKPLKEMFMAKSEPFENKINESEEKDAEESHEEEKVDEMHEKVPHGVGSDPEKGHDTTPSGINEEEDAEEEREEEEVVDETAGSAKGHAANRTVGNERMPKSSPRKDSTQREFQKQNEAYTKRLDSLIAENKKLSKAVNEKRENIAKMEEFITEAKKVIPKYREQLTEMAVFNTNLAYTNNILLNENLALTTEDKMNIVNEFKDVKSIKESQDKYNSLVESYTETKQPVNENLEEKVSNVIEPSASQQIVEQVNERTAFDKSHMDRLLKNMNYERGR